MSRKIFLDINIVIDIIDRKRKNHELAKAMVLKTIQEDYEIYISEDMITTVYYVLRGELSVLHFFNKVLDKWNIVPFGKDVIKKSIEFSMKNSCDLENVLQCFCAKECGCGIFLTSDKKFIDCGIEILDYDRFLNGQFD